MHITWSQVSWIHELRENLPNFVWVTINLSPWSLPSIAPHGAWSGGSPGARTDTGPPSYSLFIGLRPLTTQPYKYTPWGFFVYHGHSLCNFFLSLLCSHKQAFNAKEILYSLYRLTIMEYFCFWKTVWSHAYFMGSIFMKLRNYWKCE